MRLALIHQTPGAAPCPPGATVWHTCLRDVCFLREAPPGGDGRVLTGAAAYSVLLEVVCGLRSPLAGETEVHAQFKAFLDALDPHADAELLRVGQRILADAKAIRQRHLQGVRVDAYGPLAARFVPDGRRVVIVGTGALATEIVGALDGTHRIDQWGRRPAGGRRNYSELATAPFGPVRSDAPASVIVAAPVPQTDLEGLAVCYPAIREVIDLRGRHERTPWACGARVVTLDDLFQDAARSGAAASRIAAARRDALERGRAFAAIDEIRPFGWDDLCA